MVVSTLAPRRGGNAPGDTGYELTTEVMELYDREAEVFVDSRGSNIAGNVMARRLRFGWRHCSRAVRLRSSSSVPTTLCAPRHCEKRIRCPYAMPDGTLSDICGHACALVEQSWTTALQSPTMPWSPTKKASEPSIAERSARLRALLISLRTSLSPSCPPKNPLSWVTSDEDFADRRASTAGPSAANDEEAGRLR